MENIFYSLDLNAFKILKASYTSTRAEISELVENAEFDEIHSLDQIQHAQQSLLAPITRLGQEIRWLPELSTRQINDISVLLNKGNPKDIYKAIKFLPELAKTNILAHMCGMACIDNTKVSELIKTWVSELIKTWDDIDEQYLMKFINTQRRIAGFPQVEQNRISIAVMSLTEYHAKNAAQAIWALKNPGESMKTLVEMEMSRNSSNLLLSNFVQEYDRMSEPHLIRVEQELDHLSERTLHESNDLDFIIDEISQLLSQWNNINLPVQVFERYQGHEEKRSIKICNNMRALCIKLANKKNQFHHAIQLSEELLSTFSEIDSVTEMFRDDIQTLENLCHEQQKQFADLDEIALVAACESAKSRIANLDPAQSTREYMQKSQCEIIDNVIDAFNIAVKAQKTGDNAFVIVRDLALYMGNDRNDPEIAFKLIDGLIKCPHLKPSNDLFGKLDEDRSMFHDKWKIAEMKK